MPSFSLGFWSWRVGVLTLGELFSTPWAWSPPAKPSPEVPRHTKSLLLRSYSLNPYYNQKPPVGHPGGSLLVWTPGLTPRRSPWRLTACLHSRVNAPSCRPGVKTCLDSRLNAPSCRLPPLDALLDARTAPMGLAMAVYHRNKMKPATRASLAPCRMCELPNWGPNCQ